MFSLRSWRTVDTFQNNPISKMTALVKKFYIDLVVVYIAGTDCMGSCKFNYHTIKTMIAPCITLESDWNSNCNTNVPLLFFYFWIYFYIDLNKNLKNLLILTKSYWFWAGGPVLIMRTVLWVMYLKWSHILTFI
jgi:hypothetical protein